MALGLKAFGLNLYKEVRESIRKISWCKDFFDLDLTKEYYEICRRDFLVLLIKENGEKLRILKKINKLNKKNELVSKVKDLLKTHRKEIRITC